MIFNTWAFGVFAFAAIVPYLAVVPPRARPGYLIVCGAIFYAYAVPAYLMLVAALGILTYGASAAMLRLERRRRAPVFAAAVAAIVAVLAYFKYARFFESIVDAVARHDVLPVPSVVVPLAISFFTFEFVHVLADVYEGKIRQLNPRDFTVFALFFPTLVAGPIKRYESFAPQMHDLEPPGTAELLSNVYRIALGLAKKIVVADSMTVFIAPILAPGAPYRSADYVAAVVAYTIKIYFDFSAYSDIAIGLAALLGIRIPENFDRPYRARSVADFWRRWHVSLSSWIRDYVFVPLGGSRRSAPVTALNLLLAMAIAGLWHGAAWTFVVWGLWHGAGLVVHRVWSASVVPRFAVLRRPSRPLDVLSVATTLVFVAAGWIFFAAPSLPAALLVFRGLLSS